MTVISEAAEVTIGKNGNKHKIKLKDCWITNETKALVEKRDKQGQAPFKFTKTGNSKTFTLRKL